MGGFNQSQPPPQQQGFSGKGGGQMQAPQYDQQAQMQAQAQPSWGQAQPQQGFSGKGGQQMQSPQYQQMVNFAGGDMAAQNQAMAQQMQNAQQNQYAQAQPLPQSNAVGSVQQGIQNAYQQQPWAQPQGQMQPGSSGQWNQQPDGSWQQGQLAQRSQQAAPTPQQQPMQQPQGQPYNGPRAPTPQDLQAQSQANIARGGSAWGHSQGPFSTQGLSPEDQLYINKMKNMVGGSDFENFLTQNVFQEGGGDSVKNALNNLNLTNPAAVQQYDPRNYQGQFKGYFDQFFRQNPQVVATMEKAGNFNPLTGLRSTSGLPPIFQKAMANNPQMLQKWQQGTGSFAPKQSQLANALRGG